MSIFELLIHIKIPFIARNFPLAKTKWNDLSAFFETFYGKMISFLQGKIMIDYSDFIERYLNRYLLSIPYFSISFLSI